jgi:hypothetical protein
MNTISAQNISKATFSPNAYLTNMGIAHYQKLDQYGARHMFPMLQVALSTAKYYKFNKGDLARDDVKRKPEFGKVDPAHISHDFGTYDVEVDQIIMGIDSIARTNYVRTPGMHDPRRMKARSIAEKMAIHQDSIFAQKMFKKGVWSNEFAGVNATPTGKQFYKFDDANSMPIKFFDDRRTAILEVGRREPNVLGLGMDAYRALKENGDLLERIKYSGSSANPAIVNEKVLAELLGFEKVVVFKSTYNEAEVGEKDNMKFIMDSKSALMVYATSTPDIEEPSAGYMFTWDMLGNGNYMPIAQYEGEKGTHSEFMEGLMAVAFEKTADDMGLFMYDCCD